MARLEDVIKGARVKGINGPGSVTVVDVQWHGDAVLTVTYKTDLGEVGQAMIYRFDEHELEVEESLPWGFDGDAEELKLVSEAYRISLAHLFDPYLAVRTSAVDPLPHQVAAVYQEMLPRMPLRYVLADDPGAGKTVMTGLLIKEMMIRGDLKRCLIVCPGSLVEQWQDELYRKFGLSFTILTNDILEAAVTGNAFLEHDLCIARLDKLARDESAQEKIGRSFWDLIVCDEAHKMSATVFGDEARYTKRFLLGKLLGSRTENYLLLTATPHNGKPEDFQMFMSLVDPDRFEGARRSSHQEVDVSDVMRRLVKEELLRFDGRPLFPERIAYTVNYALSDAEARLYRAVTDYVSDGFNRAERLDGKRRNSVGFALTSLQRRLASSPEAIYQSLRRRRERLESRLGEASLALRGEVGGLSRGVVLSDGFDEDDFTSEELERLEDDMVDAASAAETAAELEIEIGALRKLERMANEVRVSGDDRKWDELSRLLQDESGMFGADGQREKLIIFTEHKDTLNYLAGRIRSLLGDAEAVVTIKGGMPRDERRRAEELFRQDKSVRILIATDAAGEGVNLQRGHLMINYDLPWNPNRIEQRFGRIHRIGQTEVCHLWNLVAGETREGEVLRRLFSKLEEERAALGGKVFDVLGKLSFDNKTLRDLLVEAVRYGDDPEVRNRLNLVVDTSLDTEAIRRALEERALASEMMDARAVTAIREDMERMSAQKLEPHFIEAFFIEAMAKLGGKVREREPGRYEVGQVPISVRLKGSQEGLGGPILRSYERVCFDKSLCDVQGHVPAVLLCPGHPLLDAVTALLIERHSATLKRGAVLVDESEDARTRALFYVEGSVQDGTTAESGKKRVVSKVVHFVEMDESGEVVSAGYAPYLDYRAPKPAEKAAVERLIRGQRWLKSAELEEMAMNYAVQSVVPRHLMEVRSRRIPWVDKVEKAVVSRLTAEIQYWDTKAWELKNQEDAGKPSQRLNSANAERRANELEERLRKRADQLNAERRISSIPPRIVGGALIIPARLLDGGACSANSSSESRKAIELAGMRAVMAIEEGLGNVPRDVSVEKRGYDIESRVPGNINRDAPILRMIEVKGRAVGADFVTVTKNEVLCALNNPEGFILAIVEVDGDKAKTTYLKRPFRNALDFSATSANYNIENLMKDSIVVYEKEGTWR